MFLESPYVDEVTGQWTDGHLSLDSQSHKLISWPTIGILGGLEAPDFALPSPAELPYRYHLVASVPEPSALLMLTVGLVAVSAARSRQARSSR